MLRAEFFLAARKHLADRQLIRAARLAHAAADAVGSVLGHGIVTALGPLAQTVAAEIALEQEAAGNVDALGTGLAVSAAGAAENAGIQ